MSVSALQRSRTARLGLGSGALARAADSDKDGLLAVSVAHRPRHRPRACFCASPSELRRTLRVALQRSSLALAWDVLQTLLSITACVTHVLGTYGIESPEVRIARHARRAASHSAASQVFDLVITLVFTVDYLLRLFAAERRLRYIMSPSSIVDIAAIVPAYVDMLQSNASGSPLVFVRFVRVLRVMRVLRALRLLNLSISRQFAPRSPLPAPRSLSR
jgi:hypothetical protein